MAARAGTVINEHSVKRSTEGSMSDIILRQFYEDHSNVAKVLDLLDAQISIVQQGKTPNYVVMMHAMRS